MGKIYKSKTAGVASIRQRNVGATLQERWSKDKVKTMEENMKDYQTAAQNHDVTPLREMQVSKSNLLITSRYSMTSRAQKLLTACLAKINPFEPVPPMGAVVTLTVAEIRQILNVRGNSLYEQLKKTAKNIADNSMVFYEDPKHHTFGFTTLVQSCRFDGHQMTVIFGAEATAFLYEIQKSGNGYTSYYIANILELTSGCSIRLYELFSQNMYLLNKNKPTLEISFELEELKTLLGLYNLNDPRAVEAKELMTVGEQDYKKIISKIRFNDTDFKKPYVYFSNFRQKVLDLAKKEINENTDIRVDYHETRSGNSVDRIVFSISKNSGYSKQRKKITEKYRELQNVLEQSSTSVEKQDAVIEYIMELVEGQQIKVGEARKIAEAAHYDLSLIHKAYQMVLESKSQIHNIVGWMISCIQQNWGGLADDDVDFTDIRTDSDIYEWQEVMTQESRAEEAPDRPEGLPIEELGISVAPVKQLQKAGIWTVGDILRLSRQKLLYIPMVGKKTADKIEEALRSYNLSLKES